MKTGFSFHSGRGLALALALGVLGAPGTAHAQPQTKDQRACTTTMNQALARLSGAATGEVTSCVRDAAKDQLAPASTVDQCAVADRKGKVGKASSKATGDFAKRCTGVSRTPPGAAKKAPYGVSDAETVRQAATAGALDLFHDVLGAALDAAVIREDDDKAAARCQQLVARDLRACHATILREFNGCKKAGLGDRGAPFDSASDVASCFLADAKGKIAQRCDRLDEVRPGRFQLDPLRKSLRQGCAAKGVSLAQALPICATDDLEAAHACLERAAICRSCQALALGDGLALDCDLQDDGLANASCASSLGRHACTLDADSSFFFESAAGFLGGALAGRIDLACGLVDGMSGVAPCSCALGDVAPVAVPGVGFTCLTSVAGCAAGEASCDGTTSLDFAIIADHDVGTCDGQAGCAAQCDAFCGAQGAVLWDSGCEGFCDGGVTDGTACSSDAQCSGGRCTGVAGGGHGNVCQCQCIDRTGDPSTPGGLRCDLGVRIAVEASLPCDGSDVVLDLGARCLPLTTETAQASLTDQDHVAGQNLPGGLDLIGGQALACTTLRASGPAGMVLVSAANAFDVPGAGDVYLLLGLGCD